LIMPLVALVLPSGDWRNAGIVLRQAANPKDDVALKWGDFLGTLLDFFVVAMVLFFVTSKLLQAMEKRLLKPEEAATKECPFCTEVIPVRATRCKACTSELATKK